MTVILERFRTILDDTAGWGEHAACIGQAPTLENPDLETEAKTLCLGNPALGIPKCPVIGACNTWILDLTGRQDPGGIRAGLTEKERTGARSRRTIARTRPPAIKAPPAVQPKTKPGPRPVVAVVTAEPEPVPVGMKRCRKCEQVKDRSEFYIETRAKDGLATMCAPCKRAVNAASEAKRRAANTPTTETQRRRAEAACATAKPRKKAAA